MDIKADLAVGKLCHLLALNIHHGKFVAVKYKGQFLAVGRQFGHGALVLVGLEHRLFADDGGVGGGSRGAVGAAASPNGKLVAFLYRGDVFVTPVDYSTTKQISATPEAESDLSWGNDSTLYYTSERDGRANIYRATLGRPTDEPDRACGRLSRGLSSANRATT